MTIEEAGPNPDKLAQAIHRQMGSFAGAVPVSEIARALDIVDIRFEALESFEGALLTTPERDIGSIIVNASSGKERRRFTIAHELGHYLNPWHKAPADDGFMCAKADMGSGKFIVKPGLSRREVQEMEANRFAIELLAPQALVAALTADVPSLQEALAIGTRFELSKSAGSRRYVELHHMPIAVVYTQHGNVLYHVKSPSCPIMILPKVAGFIGQPRFGHRGIQHSEIDITVRRPGASDEDIAAAVETLFQNDGYAITLLAFEPEEDED